MEDFLEYEYEAVEVSGAALDALEEYEEYRAAEEANLYG